MKGHDELVIQHNNSFNSTEWMTIDKNLKANESESNLLSSFE